MPAGIPPGAPGMPAGTMAPQAAELLPGGADLASRMRDSKAEEGFRAPVRSPRATTALWTSGGLPRSDAAALSSTPLWRMNSSTPGSTEFREWLPEPPLLALDLASLIRAMSAAEGFRAVERSPRERTIRCTSPGQFLRSLAAPSSTEFDSRNLSTSSRLGGSPDMAEAPAEPLVAGAPAG
eukprot:CAMPEP_0170578432 /NCGR_PEP_ID=MMETSP0224-20130122/5452_1 /TAXON_ID=285029 /ORGANISM="Togula jolla, Strain CCCM 725" /LENGTH=180 /DNA_ID=CAMNT_0010901399 /DNA_START=427 /DNA_END=965 /DNA_ORIENTATION=+